MTLAGFEVKPCESIAEKLGIQQFNQKLFKIREQGDRTNLEMECKIVS